MYGSTSEKIFIAGWNESKDLKSQVGAHKPQIQHLL